MSAHSQRRRIALRTVAAALAAGYAVLAAVGDGLHGLTCVGTGGCCCSSTDPADDDQNCLFCHDGAGSSHRAGHPAPESVACDEAGSAVAKCVALAKCVGADCEHEPSPPHDSNCDVCRLLAQLKTASACVVTPAIVIWAPAPVRPESDPKAPSIALPASTARGPPIA